jgi:hypothetical protein
MSSIGSGCNNKALLDRVTAAHRRGDTVEEGYRAAWRADSGLSLEAAVEEVILQVAAQPVLREP